MCACVCVCVRACVRACVCVGGWGRGGAVCPNEPSGFRGRKAILNHASALVSACP